MTIPVSVIVATLNEEARIARCLSALKDFGEVIVVDSGSTDSTRAIAAQFTGLVHDFKWNGRYPKKRQWCLDNLSLMHDFVFFVDADEIVTDSLKQEVAALDFSCAGYFIRSQYVYGGNVLWHGLHNKKMALIDRTRMHFPVVNDLGLQGMGEMEGHYQPVLKPAARHDKTGTLKSFMLHDAYGDEAAWKARHQRYALWEDGMNRRRAWPEDVTICRRILKNTFRVLPAPLRSCAAFIHCYILKAGFLDGRAGLKFARSRYDYYRMIERLSRK